MPERFPTAYTPIYLGNGINSLESGCLINFALCAALFCFGRRLSSRLELYD